jgi:hypothetical protein
MTGDSSETFFAVAFTAQFHVALAPAECALLKSAASVNSYEKIHRSLRGSGMLLMGVHRDRATAQRKGLK